MLHKQIGIFVDAAYLLVTGSKVISSGSTKSRNVVIDPVRVSDSLKCLATELSDGARLLRIYWYDGGLPNEGLTSAHRSLADARDVKLRLGIVSGLAGRRRQKGVDTLLVTDLIELSRNRSISDALLLTGDEDVRGAVQIAQSLGVRVHLLGVAPARESQSDFLRREADTMSEWDARELSEFMTESIGWIRPPDLPVGTSSLPMERAIEQAVRQIIDACNPNQLTAVKDESQPAVVGDIRGKLLAMCRHLAGRRLNPAEKERLYETLQASAFQGTELETRG